MKGQMSTPEVVILQVVVAPISRFARETSCHLSYLTGFSFPFGKGGGVLCFSDRLLRITAQLLATL